MESRIRPIIYNAFAFLGLFSACATETIEPLPVIEEVPEYVRVPHPVGYQLVDLDVLLMTPDAPSKDSLKVCDEDFRKFLLKSPSTDEIERGAREYVVLDAKKYHWCFYSKLQELQLALSINQLVTDSQRMLIQAYEFLAPLAVAFKKEYRDIRYQKWATRYYQTVSEWVFYRKLELTPEGNRDLYTVPDSGELLVQRMPSGTGSILEKYGLIQPQSAPLAPTPPAVQAENPDETATESAPLLPSVGPLQGDAPLVSEPLR